MCLRVSVMCVRVSVMCVRVSVMCVRVLTECGVSPHTHAHVHVLCSVIHHITLA